MFPAGCERNKDDMQGGVVGAGPPPRAAGPRRAGRRAREDLRREGTRAHGTRRPVRVSIMFNFIALLIRLKIW